MGNWSKELKIGVFTLISLLVFLLGLNFLKGKDIFSSDNIYYIRFNDIAQLSESSNVYVNGYKAGIVRSINYDHQKGGAVIVKIEADKEIKFPADTRGEIKESLIGELSIHLALGNDRKKNLNSGDTISGIIREGLTENIENMLNTGVQDLILKLDTTLSGINIILNDRSLRSAIENADNLLYRLSEASISLTGLLNNQVSSIAGKADSIGDNLIYLSEKLGKIDYDKIILKTDSLLDQLIKVTEKLHNSDNTAGLLLNEQTLYNELQETLTNVNALIDDIKKNPRKYIKISIF